VYGIEIPKLLSLLAYHDPNTTVRGLDTVPAADRPPVNVVRLAFQAMVASGTFLALLGAVFVFVRLRRKRLPESVWFYRAVVVAAPLSVVALLGGWITTEVGRQPWVVYRVMRTAQAVTGADGVPIGLALLTAVYVGLVLVLVWILRRLAAEPLGGPDTTVGVPPEVGHVSG
jgi:cytochrome d ubiquinol oxidase subunit I